VKKWGGGRSRSQSENVNAVHNFCQKFSIFLKIRADLFTIVNAVHNPAKILNGSARIFKKIENFSQKFTKILHPKNVN